MQKKCYVLILSKHFPAYHPKAGELTHFEEKIKTGAKIHTIRQNLEFWQHRVSEVNNSKAFLSVRQWVAKPYYSKQKEIFRYEKLGIQKIDMCCSDGSILWNIDNGNVNYPLVQIAENEVLIKNDFYDWFDGHNDLNAIIHFTNFRYE